MTDSLLAFLAPAGIVINLLIIGVLLAGLWLGLARTKLDRRARIGTWLLVAVPLLAWFVLTRTLGLAGVFQARPGIPPIPFAILLPLALGLALLLRSRRIAEVIDAVPPSWLIGLQAYRVVGGVFLAFWLDGSLPGSFAIPAGGGDMLVGLEAIPVALYLASGARGGRLAAYAWNIFGITDLVVAISLGFLTSPGIGHVLALDNPNLLVTAYPLAMIPAFAVPLSLILHGLSLWQLRRQQPGRSNSTAIPQAELNMA